jgi:Na+-driven multidrug efflux pump
LRALHQLMRGHLASALGLNPLMVLSLPFVGYYFVSRAMIVVAGRSLRTFFVKPAFIWGFLGVVLVYWVLRNLPFYPFPLLAP